MYLLSSITRGKKSVSSSFLFLFSVVSVCCARKCTGNFYRFQRENTCCTSPHYGITSRHVRVVVAKLVRAVDYNWGVLGSKSTVTHIFLLSIYTYYYESMYIKWPVHPDGQQQQISSKFATGNSTYCMSVRKCVATRLKQIQPSLKISLL